MWLDCTAETIVKLPNEWLWSSREIRLLAILQYNEQFALTTTYSAPRGMNVVQLSLGGMKVSSGVLPTT